MSTPDVPANETRNGERDELRTEPERTAMFAGSHRANRPSVLPSVPRTLNSPPIPTSATSTRERRDDGWMDDRTADTLADLVLLDAELRGHSRPTESSDTRQPVDDAPVVAGAAHCEPTP